MRVEYFLVLIIADLHLFFIIQRFSKVLLATEAEDSVTLAPKHKRMLGSITVLIGTFDGFKGKTSCFSAREADIEVCVVVILVARAVQVALVEEVGDFLCLQVEQMLADFRHVQQTVIISQWYCENEENEIGCLLAIIIE